MTKVPVISQNNKVFIPAALLASVLLLSGCQEKKYLDKREEGAITPELKEAYYFQADLNRQFSDPKDSPLKKKDLKRFEELSFFPLNAAYLVKAQFSRSADSTPFWMPTTTGRKSRERIYGILQFELGGRQHQLQVYQEIDTASQASQGDLLFLPFGDDTNGQESYPGGRYMNLSIPQGEEVLLDFNQAYNPYCAYNAKYSCPLLPAQNRLSIEIPAGVKYPEPWQHK